MFSPTFLAEFESLQLKALRILGQVLEQTDKDTTRASAALGILRLAERLFKKSSTSERAPSASSGAHAPIPNPRTAAHSPAPAPVPTPAPTTNNSPTPTPPSPFPDPSSPLSDSEVAEMLAYFPHVEPKRLRRHELAGVWRAHLIQARYWNDPILPEDRDPPTTSPSGP